METYIAMLRGINVSGQKKIKMADLKAHFEQLNFKNVQTYIQSGNVIFNNKKSAAAMLEKAIEQKILKEYGFRVPVIVKSPNELRYVLANNSFLNDQSKDKSRLYVTFLAEEPAVVHVEKLKSIDHSPEAYILDVQHIYFFSPHGYGRAKMNNNFFENKLKVAATTRNWKTVNKLSEMANGN
ncbi:MAG: hypothetical protein COA57_06240 [Flavobacteriales bacterium]|nr:DUF1697 domain-containing protein [Bacteroidales bacterium AH-315-I05]PCJ86415.1 MAG: hypothetical protein COA57_06240 [Flavobacteriales bacterium]